MNRFVFGILIGVLLVAGCMAPAPPQIGGAVETQPEPPSPTELQQRMAEIPGGAVVGVPGRVELRFANGTLFEREAVLPLPGGKAVLDPLAALLRDYPQAAWQLEVAADTEHGVDYNRRLAEKRSELLQKYLQRRGVATGSVEVVTGVGREEPVVVVYPLPPGGSSSSTGNE